MTLILSDLSARDQVLDAALAHAAHAVRSFALEHGFLTGHLCECGEAGCRQDDAGTMSLVSMLRAVATEWSAGPAPELQAGLRSHLVTFGGAFDLLCACSDPQCPAAAAADADTRSLLRTLADLWHGRAGNLSHTSPARLREIALSYATNLALLERLAYRMDPARPGDFAPVLPVYRRHAERAWAVEARAMAAEAVATWLPPPGEIGAVRLVLDSAVAVAHHGGWSEMAMAELERAASDACLALLTLGIVDPSVGECLFTPFAAAVSLADLEAVAALSLARLEPAAPEAGPAGWREVQA